MTINYESGAKNGGARDNKILQPILGVTKFRMCKMGEYHKPNLIGNAKDDILIAFDDSY